VLTVCRDLGWVDQLLRQFRCRPGNGRHNKDASDDGAKSGATRAADTGAGSRL
jgi:hypothetical protein